MSGPRVWVDENDLRLVLGVVKADDAWLVGCRSDEMRAALGRIKDQLDPPPPLPLRPYRACMQGHGA